MDKKCIYGFFDVDGTLINVKSMMRFMWFYQVYLNRSSKLLGIFKYFMFRGKLKLMEKLGKSREYLNHAYYRYFSGHEEAVISEAANHWFEWELKNNPTFFKKAIIEELNKLRANSGKVVLVSGSFIACLKGLANWLKVDGILASQLEVISGKCSGKLIPPQTIGIGKVRAIKYFLSKCSDVDLSRSYAYGDHISDLPMLELVGNPVVVAGDKQLEACAREKGWKVI